MGLLEPPPHVTIQVMSKRIAEECPKKYAVGHTHGHTANSTASAISEAPLGRRRRLSGEFLTLLMVTILAIVMIAYVYYHVDRLGRPAAIGIMVAAAALALADATMLAWIWRYEGRQVSSASTGKQSPSTMDEVDEGNFECHSFTERSVAPTASQLDGAKITVRLWIHEEKLDGEIFEQCRLTGSLPSPRTYHIPQEDFDRLIAKLAKKP